MADIQALTQIAIPLIALGISVLTFLAMHKKALQERITQGEERLQAEIARLKEELAACHGARDTLHRENVLLMERLITRGTPGPPGEHGPRGWRGNPGERGDQG